MMCPGGTISPTMESFLSRYEAASAHLHVEIVDPSVDETFAEKYSGASSMTAYSMVVASARRYRLIEYTNLSYYYINGLGEIPAATYLQMVQSDKYMEIAYQYYTQYGIDITAVETKTLDMPAENKAAVYQRMISEREKIAAQYTADGEYEAQKTRNAANKESEILLSEAKAQATVIRAEGDAEYMSILASAYDTPEKADFYTFMIALDAARESLTGGGKTLILDETSPLAQIFYGN